jgi:aspartyl-tRNA(Asn)/glutamyl-tRNA(Gln) amidotransferase subunit B
MMTIDLEGGESREIGITRLHLEQDAGKSLHDQHPNMTYIDLNRAGMALMEIVSEPDLRSAEEVAAYLTKLRSVLRYLGTCDGNMEEGSMRCDVNISMRRPGEPLGTRTETKNVNSIRFVKQAIEYEARRQVQVLEAGGEIAQETLLFDADKGVTRPMRSKEEAHDYRYFPDPDLLPLVLDPDWVEALRKDLPELPDAKKARFVSDFDLSAYDAGILAGERETAEFYEAVATGRDPKLAANWVTGEYFGALNRSGGTLAGAPVDAAGLGGLLDLIADGTISGRIAKDVFEAMWETGKPAAAIVEDKGLKQISDSGALEAIVDRVIAENPGQVEQFKSGNEKILGWFVGQIMKASQGKANPGLVNKILRDKLS